MWLSDGINGAPCQGVKKFTPRNPRYELRTTKRNSSPTLVAAPSSLHSCVYLLLPDILPLPIYRYPGSLPHPFALPLTSAVSVIHSTTVSIRSLPLDREGKALHSDSKQTIIWTSSSEHPRSCTYLWATLGRTPALELSAQKQLNKTPYLAHQHRHEIFSRWCKVYITFIMAAEVIDLISGRQYCGVCCPSPVESR